MEMTVGKVFAIPFFYFIFLFLALAVLRSDGGPVKEGRGVGVWMSALSVHVASRLHGYELLGFY